ncbi:bifunctional diguanylate cyclase/phosphodiesterase [Candidatus Sulfurimonas marisnigri]|uniref:Bifunctional diguanylate cyclase/phosphodiesterase n=1 Tax=Candidatus Sulfurimonas marisnigri TaxID=2740405 RepID=A0A7S7M2C3_9BACT|nr:bifunctional diguanylate cyclase/phosphodiesterase [Candidatus Sulfurimonas marisnigri]QOY55733.1 bifunctional diguanylate cyclase/phosphodiesterase [Candidatus Sulfurimonas marisnigri]
MELNKNTIESKSFTITSPNEVFNILENLKNLKKNNIIIHIVSFSSNSQLLQNLNNEINTVVPQAKIVFLRHNEKSKICLNVYTLQEDTETKDFSDEIFSKLYGDNTNKSSEIIKYRDKLLSRYFTDHLTNLPNVYQLRGDLEQNENFTLIIFNIDNFQTINNFYGYLIGDYVIENVAKYLQKNIPEYDIYKLSGDEFALVINKHMFFYDLKEHLNNLYNRLKDIVVKYQGTNIYINITLASSVNGDNTNIFSKVSMALRHAKEIRAHFWIYEDKMDFENNYEKKLQLSDVVREAVSNFRVVPYYQAIIDTKTSKIMKYECLARLIDINGKVLSPLDFIPIAKKIKNYHIVTKTIIDKSFATFEILDFEFTINLSIEDIIDKEMFIFIMDKLKNSKVSNKVTFEILESDAIDDFKKVERFICEVKRYGAKIAIDDFGSGYSNFSYLTKMSADFIKIDGSLVKEIDTDRNSLLVVETIVEFAKKLGIKTIAEYVHSRVIMDRVKELGVDFSQGYYIDEPSLLA